MQRTLPLLIPALLLLSGVAGGEDWIRFRGPNGSASSDESTPTTWSAKENIAWRTELPGLGTSSPITLAGRVYLTCYSGYAEARDNPGDMSQLMRHVVCLDGDSGKILWTKAYEPKLPESQYSGGNNSWHGYSSSTPTTDGQHLYVFFGKSGVYCLDLDGNEIWRSSVGDSTKGWGSSNSLVLYKDLLIVNASIESGSLIALNKKTGETAWKAEGVRGCWNTPVLVTTPAGKVELVLSMPQLVAGFDPDSGERLWTCNGVPDRGYICPSAVAHDGVVYLIGGRKNTAMAIKAGGRGDVTDSHKLWETNKGSNVSSPVFHQGYLYWVHERQGMAYCLDAKDGAVVYQERLNPRPGVVYSSALVADGKIYCVSQHSGTFVLAAEPEFKLLAHNVLEDDEHRANACPAVHNGQLLLRNDKYLYCIGTK